MSTETPMKPARRKVPALVKFGFIALEVAILVNGAIYIYLNSAYYHPTMGFVEMCLIAALFQSSVLMLFFDLRLAISGFIVLLLCGLGWFSLPVY